MDSKIQTFKRGSTFSISLRLIDLDTNKPVQITEDMQLISKLNDEYGQLISDLIATPFLGQEQEDIAGWIHFTVPNNTDSSIWRLGDAKFDLKVIKDNNTMITPTECIKIIRSES